jgi:hypothetical protein
MKEDISIKKIGFNLKQNKKFIEIEVPGDEILQTVEADSLEFENIGETKGYRIHSIAINLLLSIQDSSKDRPALNPSTSFTIASATPPDSAYKITVNDGSQRCPRSSSSHIYVTYFGTSEAGGWRP